MTKSVIVIILITFFASCSPQSPQLDCSAFKSGRFSVNMKGDSAVSLIERNDSIQIETNLKTGSISKNKIKWIGPCEYELIYVSQNSQSVDSITSYLQSHTLKVAILKTEKSYCIFESTMEGIKGIYIDTMRIAN